MCARVRSTVPLTDDERASLAGTLGTILGEAVPGRNSMCISFRALFSIACVASVMNTASSRPVHADVPKTEDVAACNREAQDAIRSDSPSRSNTMPNASDHSRATSARQEELRSGSTGQATRSPDPQLAGMDAEGAKDPEYQAAFRSCMRRSGF